ETAPQETTLLYHTMSEDVLSADGFRDALRIGNISVLLRHYFATFIGHNRARRGQRACNNGTISMVSTKGQAQWKRNRLEKSARIKGRCSSESVISMVCIG